MPTAIAEEATVRAAVAGRGHALLVRADAAVRASAHVFEPLDPRSPPCRSVSRKASIRKAFSIRGACTRASKPRELFSWLLACTWPSRVPARLRRDMSEDIDEDDVQIAKRRSLVRRFWRTAREFWTGQTPQARVDDDLAARPYRCGANLRAVSDQCLESRDLRRARAEEFVAGSVSGDGLLSARARQHRGGSSNRLCADDNSAGVAALAEPAPCRSLARPRALLSPQSDFRRSRQSRTSHSRGRARRDRSRRSISARDCSRRFCLRRLSSPCSGSSAATSRSILRGSTITIPGFLVVAAVPTRFFASSMMVWIGRRYVVASEKKMQSEAELRYSLMRFARKRRKHRADRRRGRGEDRPYQVAEPRDRSMA